MTMTLETANQVLLEDGALVDIGQVDPELRKACERAVRAGRLVKYRGYWNTLSPHFGMGPLKTIYANPAHPRWHEAA